jgi:hypothetical protein
MKKWILSIILFAYFTVSTGFVVNLHYCMGSFYSWEVGAQDKKGCDQCGMEKGEGSGCCRDEVKVIKLERDFVQTKISASQFLLPALPVTYSFYQLLGMPKVLTHTITFSHHSPLLSKQDTYLQHCVFRI